MNFEILFSLIFPSFCVACKKEGKSLCENCIRKCKKIPKQCFICKKTNNNYQTCKTCSKKTLLNFVISPFAYIKKSPIQHAITHAKYQKRFSIIKALTKHLENILKDTNTSTWLLVPIPMHPSKRKKRGFNQATIIAKYLQIHTINLLKKTKEGTAQARKDRSGRITTQHHFEVVRKEIPHNATIVLVDDIISTGATIHQAAVTIRKHYTNRIGAVSLAQTPRLFS